MIGKKEWFTYRVMGWGIRPKTWQGWAYIAVFLGLIGLTSFLPDPTKTWVYGILIGLIVLDSMVLMFELKKTHDERQNLHQLIIEKNVGLSAVLAIVLAALF